MKKWIKLQILLLILWKYCDSSRSISVQRYERVHNTLITHIMWLYMTNYNLPNWRKEIKVSDRNLSVVSRQKSKRKSSSSDLPKPYASPVWQKKVKTTERKSTTKIFSTNQNLSQWICLPCSVKKKSAEKIIS